MQRAVELMAKLFNFFVSVSTNPFIVDFNSTLQQSRRHKFILGVFSNYLPSTLFFFLSLFPLFSLRRQVTHQIQLAVWETL